MRYLQLRRYQVLKHRYMNQFGFACANEYTEIGDVRIRSHVNDRIVREISLPVRTIQRIPFTTNAVWDALLVGNLDTF